jgi:beta-alanine--pyruvate transaminase
LRGLPNVLDIRTVGITAGIDLASRPDAVGKRGYDAMTRAFQEEGMMIRSVGDTLVVTPPLIISEAQIDEIFSKLATIIRAVA